MPERDVLFFGYYTKNTPYEQEYEALKVYLENYQLDYEYWAMANRGTWQKNTQMKAEVVEQMLLKYPGQHLCYLDVDSIILSRPSLLFEIEADIAAVLFGGQELLSGVVVFDSTPWTLAVVKRWQELNKQYPDFLPDGRSAWDQRTLHMAIKERQRDSGAFVFKELPPAYNFIADLSAVKYPGVSPIILATRGSTRFKKQIDGIIE